MSNVSSDRIDDVAPGDIVLVDRGDGERSFKVVHKQPSDGGFLVTFEDDADAETFDLELAAGTVVTRSMEAKWGSDQSAD